MRTARPATGRAAAHRSVTTAVRAALGVLLPVACAGCGLHDVAICGACAALLDGRIERELPDGRTMLAAAEYSGAVRSIVLAAKEVGARPVLRCCGAALVAMLDTCEPELVVAVPASRDGDLRRGFRPVEAMLARRGVRAASLRMLGDGQQKLRGAADRRARQFLVPMRLGERVRGRRIALVDDVVTTGSTVIAAAAALETAGAVEVSIVALASTARRFAKGEGDSYETSSPVDGPWQET